MSPPDNMEVDHINGDKLDNRKENLRVCTHRENGKNQKISINNTSGYKGVFANHKNWQAVIGVDGKPIYLGTYPSPEKAAEAYDVAAKKYHGDFANLNFKNNE